MTKTTQVMKLMVYGKRFHVVYKSEEKRPYWLYEDNYVLTEHGLMKRKRLVLKATELWFILNEITSYVKAIEEGEAK